MMKEKQKNKPRSFLRTLSSWNLGFVFVTGTILFVGLLAILTVDDTDDIFIGMILDTQSHAQELALIEHCDGLGWRCEYIDESTIKFHDISLNNMWTDEVCNTVQTGIICMRIEVD